MCNTTVLDFVIYATYCDHLLIFTYNTSIQCPHHILQKASFLSYYKNMMPSALCKIVISFNKNHEYPFVSVVPTIDKAFVFTFLNTCSPRSLTCSLPTSALGAHPTYYSTTVLYFVMKGLTNSIQFFSKDKISRSFRRLHINAFCSI